MLTRLAATLAISLGLLGTASADHWMQTADPQVLQALNELQGFYGSYCQAGSADGCQMVQMVEQHGMQMLNAGYECQMNGNQQACQFYAFAYQQLEQTYYAAQQQLAQQQVQNPSAGYAATDHWQRMEQIQNWGQQRLDWGNQQSQMMDDSHQRFMQTLRE